MGSNLSSAGTRPLKIVNDALLAICDAGIHLNKVSSFYLTPSHPPGSGPDFVNAVAAICSDSPAQELLGTLHVIEQQFGRRREKRWGARSLDLDLLAMDEAVLPNVSTQQAWANKPLADQMRDVPDTLIVPHPRLQDRAFVLVPWNEIAPDWRHPITGLTVAQMLKKLPKEEIEAIERIG